MMHVLPCDRVRDDLAAFHDGELSVEEQVLIQSHLQECIACKLEAEELAALGQALRELPVTNVPPPLENANLTDAIIERVRVERQFAFGAQVRGLFDDMHLVWAGLGASVATVICLYASAGVLHAASSERPDSLAGIINYLATPGSNLNPLLLDGYMLAPRAHVDTAMPATGENTTVTLAAVVSREGLVQNLAVLDEYQGATLKVKPEVLEAMFHAASRARFQPAQDRGAPVAVNLVWVIETTTVKGRPDYDLYRVRPPAFASPMLGPSLPPKPRPVVAPKVAPSTGELSAAG